MRQLLSFVLKEFRHILRDPPTMAIVLGLPIVMLVMFGFAITTEVKNIRFAVHDPAGDAATRALAIRLGANESFHFVRALSQPSDIDEAFQRGEVALVVAFSDRFQKRLARGETARIALIADGSDPNTARTITQYATSIIGAWASEQAQGTALPFRIEPVVKLLYNPRMKSAYNFVPGVMGMILILVCAMMTSISIAREKELGTMEVLLASPLNPVKILLAKTVPYFALSAIDLTTILLLSVHVLGVPIVGSVWLLILLSVVFILLALCLGLLISSVVRSQVAALLISGMAMIMPVMMLSGMMFPIESMPVVLQWISHLVPARCYIVAVKKVMIKGLGLSAVGKELAILCAMTVVLFVASVKKHKARLG